MPQNIYHVCENNFDEFVYLTLIHYFVYSYNGILGDYAVNNHDITVQFMRRFLIGHQLAVADWPDVVTPDFLGTIYATVTLSIVVPYLRLAMTMSVMPM